MSVQRLTPAAAISPLPAARGSSFYAALRILPTEQRQAMMAIYGFCRAVDDIADRQGDRQGDRAARLAELALWRKDVADVYAHGAGAARLSSLAEPIRRFDLARADFEAVIDGMVMDAETDIRAPAWSMLDLYCDRVASAVGRHCVRIFRVPEEQGGPLAHHLGRALQLTNILRDLDEDAALGRLYVPRTLLAGAGITETEPLRVMLHPNIAVACMELVARARNHFAEAAQIMDVCPRATVRSPRLMASVYRRILDELAAQGFVAPRRRVRLRKSHVLWAILRHSLF